ncbi:glycosyltransferase family 39 protein, partial [Candidatus Sumerlaeota bacterium]|nr:glycosyltransferase family 39 protein [Candidatus Sumerlaeota bacterium]
MMPLSGNSQSQETPADPDLEVFPALALLLLLFAGSAALRIWLNPLIRCPSIFGDEWSYLELARSFARGAWPRMQAMPFNFRSYLYSVVIAPIAGHFEIEQAIEWICALNALMMSGTIFIAYAFTREIASRRSALVAAFFVALIPGFGLTGTIMTENLFMPASLLALWLSYRAVNHPAALRQIAAGFSLGLLYYIKPHGLIYPVIFFLIAVGTETFNAREHSAAGWPWKRYFFSISRYAWTGLSCLAVLAAQFPIIHYLFHEEDYLTLQSFLGSYYSRAVGERPFLWRDFGWVLFGNAATMIIATGFFPAIHFARTLWAAARGVALTAAAAVVVFWILTSRHTVVADPVPRLHERYMMIMDPLIWVLFAGSVGAAPGRLRGQAAGALGVAAISAINIFYAFNLRWFLLSDSPSLCGFLLAFIPSIAPVWMLPAYILVSALSLVFLLVSIWVRPLRVPAIIALLINLNGSYY